MVMYIVGIYSCIYYVHGHSISYGIIKFLGCCSGVAGGSMASFLRVKKSKKHLNRSIPEDEATR